MTIEAEIVVKNARGRYFCRARTNWKHDDISPSHMRKRNETSSFCHNQDHATSSKILIGAADEAVEKAAGKVSFQQAEEMAGSLHSAGEVDGPWL